MATTITAPIVRRIDDFLVSSGVWTGGGGTGGTGGGGGIPSPPNAALDPTGDYDILIGDIPFTAAYSQRTPYQRATQPYQKNQVDQSPEPGDQSLSTWWLRSQSTFHLGAGRRFMEPADSSDVSADYQFDTSMNVDVWTPGFATLLPRQMPQAAPSSTGGTGGMLSFAQSGGTLTLAAWYGSALSFYYGTGDTLTTAAGTPGTTGTILSGTTDGTHLWFADATGIYKDGALAWHTGAANVTIGFVKLRLMAAIGPSIYDLDGSGGSTPPALPTALFTHPNPDWVWTAITEGPDAIYMSGYAGNHSEIFKFLLDTSGAVPQLTTGIAAGIVPDGELIYSMKVYLNGYLVLGTNRGIRVCLITGNGDGGFYLGGLCYVPPAGAGPVTALTGYDRFVLGAWNQAHADGSSGSVRIDLSQLIGTAKYAYAPDRSIAANGNILGMALLDDRLAMLAGPGTDAAALYVDSSTLLASHGFVKTGRIRFHTLDDKLFKYLQMVGGPLVGEVQATLFDVDDQPSQQPIIYQPQGMTLPAQILGLGPQQYVAVQMDMYATVAGTSGPTLHGYQLKALPAGRRQRQETLTLNLFDHEMARNGQRFGWDGWALSRLLRLEALEVAADGVLLQHLTADPEGFSSRLVVIDNIIFIQETVPSNVNGWGGLVQVTVHSIDSPANGT